MKIVNVKLVDILFALVVFIPLFKKLLRNLHGHIEENNAVGSRNAELAVFKIKQPVQIFRLFLSSAVWYLKRLKQINSLIEKAKRNLDREVNNESLIGLSRLQDSLTYFITSIRGNETLLSKLKFKLQIDELDADLIEDVNIEMTQARETTNIYSNILESTMDTYSSIINNNMNTVMRTLTSVSILMMFPTLIASLFGMNLVNGMEESHYGFVIAIVISVAISGLFWWIFRHKRLI